MKAAVATVILATGVVRGDPDPKKEIDALKCEKDNYCTQEEVIEKLCLASRVLKIVRGRSFKTYKTDRSNLLEYGNELLARAGEVQEVRLLAAENASKVQENYSLTARRLAVPGGMPPVAGPTYGDFAPQPFSTAGMQLTNAILETAAYDLQTFPAELKKIDQYVEEIDTTVVSEKERQWSVNEPQIDQFLTNVHGVWDGLHTDICRTESAGDLATLSPVETQKLATSFKLLLEGFEKVYKTAQATTYSWKKSVDNAALPTTTKDERDKATDGLVENAMMLDRVNAEVDLAADKDLVANYIKALQSAIDNSSAFAMTALMSMFLAVFVFLF